VSDSDLHDRYEVIFEGIEAPFAFLDLDALAANADEMLGRAAGKPIRLATKSLRCREVIGRIQARDERFGSLLCFTVAEALMLAEAGHRDILVAYPSVDQHALSALMARASEEHGTAPVLLVDDTVHLDLIEGAAGRGPAPVNVAIDVDVGYRALRGAIQIGPKRSPIRTPEAARAMAAEIDSRPGLRLDGLMAYEGQIAGVGDATPGRALRNAGIRRMQRAAIAEVRERRAAIVAAVSEVAELRFVNGGGTGSLASTAAEDAITELAAGSGFYAPALFDSYSSFSLTPAAGFALPIVRRSAPGCVTALGGGYVASGAPGDDRLPVPWLPPGLHLDRREGAGEAQTPLLGQATLSLRIGDRVYMRHAKAGELCERFDRLYLVEGDAIVSEAPTYRGEGLTYL
jgi:D-serine deaminase-like pyridoxal phosphate-dependent protein